MLKKTSKKTPKNSVSETSNGKTPALKPVEPQKTVSAPAPQKPAAKAFAPVEAEKPAEIQKTTTPAKPKTPPAPAAAPAAPVTLKQAAVVTTKPAEAAAKPAVVAAKPAPAVAKPLESACAPAPAASSTIKVPFCLEAGGAGQVLLCGTFNGWQPGAAVMRRNGSRWETSLELSPGRYQYKFIVDGQWIHDPNAKENVYNEHGSFNSVIEVV